MTLTPMIRTMTSAELEDKLYWYRATVTRITDGDTVWLTMDQGFRGSQNEDIRLFGIDTPETRGPNAKTEREAGLRATARVTELIPVGSSVWINTKKTRRGDKKGKYGRYLGDIFVELEDGVLSNLNDKLVAEGYAEVYLP